MELWIRSQDKKELRPSPKLRIQQIEKEFYVLDNYDFDSDTILGKYKSLKRAIEVLDEIQETLCLDKFNYEDIDKTCYQDCYRYKSGIIAVYEMPKE